MLQIITLCAIVILVLFLVTMLGINKCTPEKNTESKLSFALAAACVLVMGMFCYLICAQPATPKVIETPGQPQIDTCIMIIDGVADTSYIYTFPNYFVD